MYKYKYYDPDDSYANSTWYDDDIWHESRVAHLEYARATKKILSLWLKLRERLQEVESDMRQSEFLTEANDEYAEELRDTIDWLTNATLDLTESNFVEPYPLSSVLYNRNGWDTYAEKSLRVEECMSTIKRHIRTLVCTYNTYVVKAKELLAYDRDYLSPTWEAPVER